MDDTEQTRVLLASKRPLLSRRDGLSDRGQVLPGDESCLMLLEFVQHHKGIAAPLYGSLHVAQPCAQAQVARVSRRGACATLGSCNTDTDKDAQLRVHHRQAN
jgi:hypothetical protein